MTEATTVQPRDPATDLAVIEASLDELKEQVRELPDLDCSTLTVNWERLIDLLEQNLAEVGDAVGPGADEARILVATGIVDLTRLTQTMAAYEEEICRVQARLRQAETHLETARLTTKQYLHRAGNQIRGNNLPSLASVVDQSWRWNTPKGAAWTSGNILITRNGRRAAREFIRAVARVRDGVVTLNIGTGRQSQGWEATFHYGWGFIHRNRLTFTAYSDVRGFRLSISGSRRCRGKKNVLHCWGNALGRIHAGDQPYRLSSILAFGLRGALQTAVTARCAASVKDRGKLEDVVLQQRGEIDDPDTLDLFDDASELLVRELGRLGRAGSDDVCHEGSAKLVDDLIDRAVRRGVRHGTVDTLKVILEETRVSLQGRLDRIVRTLVEIQTIGELALATDPGIGTTTDPAQ